MDEYRRRIRGIIEEKRGPYELAPLSRALGHNDAYLQQFLVTGKPRELKERDRHALAKLLNVDERTLRLNPTVQSENVNVPITTLIPNLPHGPLGPRDLPLMGETVAGDIGEFSLNGTIKEHLARPAQLAGVPQAYAVYIVGDTMEPVAYNGQVAYINPNRPPSPRGLVIVRMRDGKAMIKALVKQQIDLITVHQFNPPCDFDIPWEKIESVHRIVLHGDPP